jgi:hypothetical protein
MGIDHYNCCCCGRIFADVDSHLSCDNCDAMWCNQCFQSYSGFYLGEDMFCEECFETEYSCKIDHNCGGSMCERISVDYPEDFERRSCYDEEFKYKEATPKRGICCVSANLELCEACKKAQDTKRIKM